MARTLIPLLSALLLLIVGASAQFQFFDQMFNGQQEQRHEPQNGPSDSGWYQQNYENGTTPPPRPLNPRMMEAKLM
ncbi:uncharacterized protein BP5553_05816 [Venustampulla echinocandica]|uniref:Long chronological lifespan protein 2 n=1 Tax=Venustampulla echinocandica TaxID=2656787 RepID=A0A370TLR4_9HELO|nr:uncharacterized protein BP5553_05816 [Venustampulla echinocandica]RDL36464.1 hypothetical protein BP5553_05816 [Venustampulla echinocandica]